MTTIDVVVLAWNDGPLLDRAVASVLASTGVTPQIIIVDNGSAPPVIAPPGMRLLRNPVNLGVAVGRNQGIGAGTGELVCLLDSDAELLPTSLATMASVLEADLSVGLVAPVFVGQRPEDSAGLAPSLWRKVARTLGLTSSYAGSDPVGGPQRDVDFAIGACQVFRRTAFDAVGGLDEAYFYGPEDVDFCLRMRLAGWRVVQRDDAQVTHPPRRRSRKLLTRRGRAHAQAVARHLWRHRRFRRTMKCR